MRSIAVVAGFMLVGCAASRSTEPWGILDVEDAKRFKRDRATKSEILKYFGEPQVHGSNPKDPGKETWQYYGVKSQMECAEGRSVTCFFEGDTLLGIYYLHSYFDGKVPPLWKGFPVPVVFDGVSGWSPP